MGFHTLRYVPMHFTVPIFEIVKQTMPSESKSDFDDGKTIHARRNLDPEKSVTVRKIGVSPPIMSEQTARRQDKWDKDRSFHERLKKRLRKQKAGSSPRSPKSSRNRGDARCCFSPFSFFCQPGRH